MTPSLPSPDSQQIAQRLRELAEILQAQNANPFRVGAYRRAAESVERFPGDLRELFESEGRGLEQLSGVCPGIAAAIAEMLETGHWTQLERLHGRLDPAALFRTVPGIGPELAQRIHGALGVETLEALEMVCHDGRLSEVPGVGQRRAAAIRAALAQILDRSRLRRREYAPSTREPPVDVLLDVDREYRDKVKGGELATIAPRRFNAEGKSWLPVLHVVRDGWHFTALFSNTARAHELGRTREWVVLYFYDDHHAESQRTVVTEQRGPLAGHRVIRGREPECRTYYATLETAVAD